MGVPALFRWLSRKYPKIISPVVEEDADEEIGGALYSDPNPNGEVDNLYLDMNGIVHPCSHPEHKPAPATEDEMFLDVFTYTDRVLMMARPRKVLMIAVDGVAPRAKMNQQRARRFRSAQEAKIKDEERERELNERELRGEIIDNAIKEKKSWDSNAITPGTPFMDGLAAALRYWVAYKLATDPGWANLQVIISDATVPGEGEHKLMSFIRSQRSDPQYNPNTKHCIYGLDADLIFLGLATHEPHFRVLREDVFANQDSRITVAQQLTMTQEQRDNIAKRDKKKPFLWLHVNVLREYLQIELNVPRMSFPFDLERAIDDWVFMCFFVGNDFLPHLPSLDVRDNGIDILVNCWKRLIPHVKEYITCDGKLNLALVEKLMSNLAYKETEIFRKRHENESRREENNKRRKMWQEEDKALKQTYLPQVTKGKDKAPIVADVNMPLMTTKGETVEGYANLSNKDIVQNRDIITKANLANNEAALALKKLIESKGKTDVKKEESDVGDVNPVKEEPSAEIKSGAETAVKTEPVDESKIDVKKRTAEDSQIDEEDDGNEDRVRLWEPGFRERYYKTKFHLKTSEEVDQTRRQVVRSYLEGISWVLLYYYQGCPSWQWYYPYHYAPFAADFTDFTEIISEEGIVFKQGQPFRPYEQLMSVLPAASGHNLPEVFRDLMSNPDSDIIDFYPEDFKIDMNGAKMSWQGIALLPFIDEMRLLEAVQAKYKLLTPKEMDRNTNKQEVLFISRHNKNFKRFLEELYENKNENLTFKFAKSSLSGVASKVDEYDIKKKMFFPLNEGEMPDIENGDYMQVQYAMPPKIPGKSMLLNGFIPHVKALTFEDINTLQQPHHQRNRGGGRFNAPPDNSEYVNRGPKGKDLNLAYTLRRGGYRALKDAVENRTDSFEQQMSQDRRVAGNYGSGFNNNFRGNHHGGPQNGNGKFQNRGQGQGYGQGYNQGYSQNQNQGYNQGYNRGYGQNQNYNQGSHQYNQNYNGYGGGNGAGNGYNRGNDFTNQQFHQANQHQSDRNGRSGYIPPPNRGGHGGRNGYR